MVATLTFFLCVGGFFFSTWLWPEIDTPTDGAAQLVRLRSLLWPSLLFTGAVIGATQGFGHKLPQIESWKFVWKTMGWLRQIALVGFGSLIACYAVIQVRDSLDDLAKKTEDKRTFELLSGAAHFHTALAQNPIATKRFLQKQLKNGSRDSVIADCKNPSLPAANLRTLARSKKDHLRRCAIDNPTISERELKKLAKDKITEISGAAIEKLSRQSE